MVRIKSFGVLQTAKLAAILYFISSAIFVIPIMLISFIAGSSSGIPGSGFGAMFSGVFLIIMPILYGIFGFIFVAIGCLLYNVIAKFVGGIEIELEKFEFF